MFWTIVSTRDYYDFSMCVVKSVLVMATVLKHESSNINEDLGF
jgi:hypothetical protein